MRGGASTTREMRLGIDWRPLMASLSMHFLIALGMGLLLTPSPDRPRQSISLAQVTLQSPKSPTSFLESAESSQSEQNGPDEPAEFPSEDEAPITAASASLAALRPTASGPGVATHMNSPNSSLNQTPSGKAILIGESGTTAADERLMAKDIERYLASQPPSGPSTEFSLFGGKLTGHSFVFVIDRSASTASKHYAACAEIERQCALAIDDLPGANRFGLVLYNDRVSAGNGLKLASKKEKEEAKERMIRYSPSGGTMHMDGLRAALLQRSNVVCWFSDGDDPYLSMSDVENLSLLAGRSKSVIHAWRLGKRRDSAAQDFMRVLAERTGGEFHEGIPLSR
jgi:hypothetical protein